MSKGNKDRRNEGAIILHVKSTLNYLKNICSNSQYITNVSPEKSTLL